MSHKGDTAKGNYLGADKSKGTPKLHAVVVSNGEITGSGIPQSHSLVELNRKAVSLEAIDKQAAQRPLSAKYTSTEEHGKTRKQNTLSPSSFTPITKKNSSNNEETSTESTPVAQF